MTNYSVIDTNGLIVNRVALDDPSKWTPPDGYSIQLEPSTGYKIGGTFVNNVYTPPVEVINNPIIDPIDAWDLVSLKIAFNHENRIRVLEAKPAITLTQFKTAIRTLL